jgi:hypothetical protein
MWQCTSHRMVDCTLSTRCRESTDSRSGAAEMAMASPYSSGCREAGPTSSPLAARRLIGFSNYEKGKPA